MEHRDWKNSLQETAGAPRLPQGRLLRRTDGPWPWRQCWCSTCWRHSCPEQWAQIDLTGSGIYNISETSQDYLAGLEDDVVIHVLTDQGHTGYPDRPLSGHLRRSQRPPDPGIHRPHGLSLRPVPVRCGADTIVVTCEATGRQESFDISDIIGYDMMSYYYYGTYTETDFDGESLLTSAIDSVLTGVTRMVYETTGHNETAVPISVKERFTRLHMSVERVNPAHRRRHP